MNSGRTSIERANPTNCSFHPNTFMGHIVEANDDKNTLTVQK